MELFKGLIFFIFGGNQQPGALLQKKGVSPFGRNDNFCFFGEKGAAHNKYQSLERRALQVFYMTLCHFE
jgi:hypothetical protein